MRRKVSNHALWTLVLLLFSGMGVLGVFHNQEKAMAAENALRVIELPGPKTDGRMVLEQTLIRRRSVRSYRDSPLTLEEVGQLLWATQGISSERGYRVDSTSKCTR